jgi:hypothetical protein
MLKINEDALVTLGREGNHLQKRKLSNEMNVAIDNQKIQQQQYSPTTMDLESNKLCISFTVSPYWFLEEGSFYAKNFVFSCKKVENGNDAGNLVDYISNISFVCGGQVFDRLNRNVLQFLNRNETLCDTKVPIPYGSEWAVLPQYHSFHIYIEVNKNFLETFCKPRICCDVQPAEGSITRDYVFYQTQTLPISKIQMTMLPFVHCLFYLVIVNPPSIPKKVSLLLNNKVLAKYSLHPERNDENGLLYYKNIENNYYVVPLMHNHSSLDTLESEFCRDDLIVNASQIDNLCLDIDMGKAKEEQPLEIFVRNLQFVRVREGLAGLAFSK